jgi:phage/plasmid-associated DNA primase
MTGGDMVSARFMRGNFFQYKPEFKLLIAGNHKPALSGVDEAMRRRIHAQHKTRMPSHALNLMNFDRVELSA